MSETKTTIPPTAPAEALGVEGEAAALPPASRRRRLVVGALVVAAAIATALVFGGERPEGAEHYGFASVLPALVTLTLVFVTREVVSSLFLGIVVGGLVSANYDIIDAYLLPAIGSESYAIILLVYLWCLGGLIGLWTRTGGARHFADWAGQRIVRGPRSAAFFAWFMGLVFHQGGTISTILAGTTVRPVTDAHRVSHEEVSYIVDSTASPVASIIPLNAWPIYVAGLVVGTTPLFPTEQDAVSFFFSAVPFNFYGILAVLSTLFFALDLLPWEGRKMRRARLRSRQTGELNAPGARPLASEELSRLRIPRDYPTGLADFLLPLAVLIGVAISGVLPALPALLAGGTPSINVPIAEAFGLSVLSAIVLALLKGMSLQDAVEGFVDGAKGVTIGAIILGLAVTLGQVSRSLGTAAYIVDLTAEALDPVFLPALFMAVTMAISFSTGTSFGTYAVFFPIAMPLAWAVQPNDPFFLTLCFGAVVGGSVYGDQCSPISDTTILSSVATGADLMDHVTTQLPLATVVAGISMVLYTVLAAFA